jgi:hypothetical protein
MSTPREDGFATLNEGGGGPHCITQQDPAGTPVSP